LAGDGLPSPCPPSLVQISLRLIKYRSLVHVSLLFSCGHVKKKKKKNTTLKPNSPELCCLDPKKSFHFNNLDLSLVFCKSYPQRRISITTNQFIHEYLILSVFKLYLSLILGPVREWSILFLFPFFFFFFFFVNIV
jgi:hypothetical protein